MYAPVLSLWAKKPFNTQLAFLMNKETWGQITSSNATLINLSIFQKLLDLVTRISLTPSYILFLFLKPILYGPHNSPSSASQVMVLHVWASISCTLFSLFRHLKIKTLWHHFDLKSIKTKTKKSCLPAHTWNLDQNCWLRDLCSSKSVLKRCGFERHPQKAGPFRLRWATTKPFSL